MKTQIFIPMLLLLAVTVNGQIKQHATFLGGQVYYYNNKFEVNNLNQRSQNGNLAINIGKAFRENKVVGLNLTYSPNKQSNYLVGSDTANLKDLNYGIGMFYRAYKKLAKDFYLFGQADGNINIGKRTENYSSVTNNISNSYRGVFLAFTPGISYQLCKQMQFEITIPNIVNLMYSKSKYNNPNQTQSNNQQEQFAISSYFSNYNLGNLGVGFHFIF